MHKLTYDKVSTKKTKFGTKTIVRDVIIYFVTLDEALEFIALNNVETYYLKDMNETKI